MMLLKHTSSHDTVLFETLRYSTIAQGTTARRAMSPEVSVSFQMTWIAFTNCGSIFLGAAPMACW